MPRFYNAPNDIRDAFFPKALGERIIGTDESRREEKTFLPDQQTVIFLSIIRNTARRVIKMLQVAHYARYQEELTDFQITEKYQSARSWIGIHNDLVSHFNSNGGFGVKMAVRAEEMRLLEEVMRRETATQQGATSGTTNSPSAIVQSK